jgi:hypothetical protein
VICQAFGGQTAGISAAFVLSLSACAAASTLPPNAASAPTVHVSQGEGGHPWRITYAFGEPMARLRFDRPAGYFREDHWRVLTPGYALDRDGDWQVLRALGGAVADTIVLELAVHTAPLPREYEAFLAFTDGSSAIYTGHLTGTAFGPDGDSTRVGAFRFSASDGNLALIPGASRGAEISWTDPDGRGTYVYFGGADPIETDRVVLVMDRGMPVWLSDIAANAIPAFFRLYAERTGVDPDARPVVLLGRDPATAPGLNSGGGVLPGLIQLTVQGEAWDRPSTAGTEQVMHFIAHEVAHVWNGDYVRSRDPAEAWMHEGGADAFADRALLARGLIDGDGFDRRVTEALNRCVALLEGRSLRSAASRGLHDATYSCGTIIALWTEASLPAGEDLFGFWGELLRRAREGGGTYDQDLYLATARSLGIAGQTVQDMERFTESEHGDTRTLLVGALSAAGVRVETDPLGSEGYRDQWGRRLFAALMEADCGAFSFYGIGAAYQVASGVTCGALREGSEATSAAGFALVDEGPQAYDAVREACVDTSAAVTVGFADGSSAALPCPTGLPERPLALRVRTGS